MPDLITTSGKAPFQVPGLPQNADGSEQAIYTSYTIFGDLEGSIAKGVVPVLGIHGGPGAGHNFLLPFTDLWTKYSIPLILYDQIGCGKSSMLPEKDMDASFWTLDHFGDELDNLVAHLQLSTFDALGHSWGGRLLSWWIPTRQPRGLRKAIFIGAPVDMVTMRAETEKLRLGLPKDVADTLKTKADAGDTDSPEYKAAFAVFFRKHACTLDPPLPPEILATAKNMAVSKTHRLMIGNSIFRYDGTLKDFNSIPFLHKIKNQSLIINGAADSTTEKASAPLFEHIEKAKWVIMPNSSHSSMFEERERLIETIVSFHGYKTS